MIRSCRRSKRGKSAREAKKRTRKKPHRSLLWRTIGQPGVPYDRKHEGGIMLYIRARVFPRKFLQWMAGVNIWVNCNTTTSLGHGANQPSPLRCASVLVPSLQMQSRQEVLQHQIPCASCTLIPDHGLLWKRMGGGLTGMTEFVEREGE